MAFRRRFKSRRRFKRRAGRSSYRTRGTWSGLRKRGFALQDHKFKRKTYLGQLSIPAGGTGYTGAAQSFKLTDLPNSGEFTALFDQYTISYVKWYLILRSVGWTIGETNNNQGMAYPNITCAIDLDDTSTPASSLVGYQDIQQYAKSRSFAFTPEKRVFKMRLVPAIAAPTYISGVSTGYRVATRQKIDCNYDTVPHYGMRYVVAAPYNAGPTGMTIFFDIYATYYLSMHNVR